MPQFPSRIAIALGTLGWRERPFYVFLTLQRFDTAKTHRRHADRRLPLSAFAFPSLQLLAGR